MKKKFFGVLTLLVVSLLVISCSSNIPGDDTPGSWKGNPYLDKFIPNKNILSKYCLSC